jgi:hypothetical protein
MIVTFFLTTHYLMFPLPFPLPLPLPLTLYHKKSIVVKTSVTILRYDL